MRRESCLIGWAALLLASTAARVSADQALVAVATNFAEVVAELEVAFERQSEHQITIVSGSTGKLYAQISNGAPFDVLLAADQERPALLEADGGAVPGSRFTYAVGRLTLWSRDPQRIGDDGPAVLKQGQIARLAIANPELAPYGLAARQVLERLDVWDALRDRLVMGENVGQTHALVATGNAELGFVALSYVLSPRNRWPGSRWDVPAALHEPIRQDAVLLRHGQVNTGASAFLRFLRSASARRIIEGFGYAPADSD